MTKNKVILFYHYLFYRSYYHNWLSSQKDQEKMDRSLIGASKFSLIISIHFYLIYETINIFFGTLIIPNYLIPITTILIYSMNFFIYILGNKYIKKIDYFEKELKETHAMKDIRNKHMHFYLAFLLLVYIFQKMIIVN